MFLWVLNCSLSPYHIPGCSEEMLLLSAPNPLFGPLKSLCLITLGEKRKRGGQRNSENVSKFSKHDWVGGDDKNEIKLFDPNAEHLDKVLFSLIVDSWIYGWRFSGLYTVMTSQGPFNKVSSRNCHKSPHCPATLHRPLSKVPDGTLELGDSVPAVKTLLPHPPPLLLLLLLFVQKEPMFQQKTALMFSHCLQVSTEDESLTSKALLTTNSTWLH